MIEDEELALGNSKPNKNQQCSNSVTRDVETLSLQIIYTHFLSPLHNHITKSQHNTTHPQQFP